MGVNAIGEFPSATRLWKGTVLATIAHALYVARNDSFVGGRTWNGNCYYLTDDQSTYGIVAFRDPTTFRDRRLIGLFCNTRSRRFNEVAREGLDWRPRLAGMPPDLLEWVEQEVLGKMPVWRDGDPAPAITAAFWSTGERLTAAEPWTSVLDHGANVLTAEFLDFEEAVAELQEEYLEEEDDQVALLRRLYRRKISDPSTPVFVRREERKVVEAYGDRGIPTSRELLAAVGIVLS